MYFTSHLSSASERSGDFNGALFVVVLAASSSVLFGIALPPHFLFRSHSHVFLTKPGSAAAAPPILICDLFLLILFVLLVLKDRRRGRALGGEVHSRRQLRDLSVRRTILTCWVNCSRHRSLGCGIRGAWRKTRVLQRGFAPPLKRRGLGGLSGGDHPDHRDHSAPQRAPRRGPPPASAPGLPPSRASAGPAPRRRGLSR